jgi:hypothetical protein
MSHLLEQTNVVKAQQAGLKTIGVGAGIVAAVMLSYSSVQWLSAFTPSQKLQH